MCFLAGHCSPFCARSLPAAQASLTFLFFECLILISSLRFDMVAPMRGTNPFGKSRPITRPNYRFLPGSPPHRSRFFHHCAPGNLHLTNAVSRTWTRTLSDNPNLASFRVESELFFIKFRREITSLCPLLPLAAKETVYVLRQIFFFHPILFCVLCFLPQGFSPIGR